SPPRRSSDLTDTAWCPRAPLWTARARGGSEVAEQRASETGQDDRTDPPPHPPLRAHDPSVNARQHGTPPARHAASTARRPVPPIPTAGGPDRGNGCACREAGGRNRGRDRSTRDGGGRARGTGGKEWRHRREGPRHRRPDARRRRSVSAAEGAEEVADAVERVGEHLDRR